jgi:hypothetical protein
LPEKEWETKYKRPSFFVVDVIPDYDNNRLVMYYMCRFLDEVKQNLLCIAYSEDGITWIKPDLGDGTNIIMKSTWNKKFHGEWVVFSVIKDNADKDKPWKMILVDHRSDKIKWGIYGYESKDGIKWTKIIDRCLFNAAVDACSLIKVRDGLYYIYQQNQKFDFTLPTERDSRKNMRRHISLWQWVAEDNNCYGPYGVLEPDKKDPKDLQFYWLTPFEVNISGADVLAGFLNVYHTKKQTMESQLVISVDGKKWYRAYKRKVIIPLGAKGQFDHSIIYITAKPIKWNNEILVYYNGNAYAHDDYLPQYKGVTYKHLDGIGLAKFKEEE